MACCIWQSCVISAEKLETMTIWSNGYQQVNSHLPGQFTSPSSSTQIHVSCVASKTHSTITILGGGIAGHSPSLASWIKDILNIYQAEALLLNSPHLLNRSNHYRLRGTNSSLREGPGILQTWNTALASMKQGRMETLNSPPALTDQHCSIDSSFLMDVWFLLYKPVRYVERFF